MSKLEGCECTVDWNHPVLTSRVVSGKSRTESRFGVTCPTCQQVRLLRKSDAKKAERSGCKCFMCSQREKAKKGYAATAAKHGKHSAIEHVQAYRLAHPSALEMQLSTVLTAMGRQFEREVWLEVAGRIYLIDFVVDGVFAIEVNGGWVHQFHAERDQRKMNAIRAEGYRLLVMSDHDVQNAPALLSPFFRSLEVAAA